MYSQDDMFWIDGEWILPHDDENFSTHAEAQLKWHYPRASNYKLVPYYRKLLEIAESFHGETGRHLNVYGDIGELYGAIEYGITLNKMFAQGADGRLGTDHVEIKTISPLSVSGRKEVRRGGNWNKILLVRIDDRFDVRGYLLDRKDFPGKGQKLRIKWDEGLSKAAMA